MGGGRRGGPRKSTGASSQQKQHKQNTNMKIHREFTARPVSPESLRWLRTRTGQTQLEHAFSNTRSRTLALSNTFVCETVAPSPRTQLRTLKHTRTQTARTHSNTLKDSGVGAWGAVLEGFVWTCTLVGSLGRCKNTPNSSDIRM